jgi:hypothetical protein
MISAKPAVLSAIIGAVSWEQEDNMHHDLEFRGGFVTGLVGGKLLNCMVNPPLGGSAAVAGAYVIQPPMVDPVFGLLAVITPLFGQGGGSGVKDYGGNEVIKFWDKTSPGGGAMDGKFFGKYTPGGGAMDGKFFGKYTPGGGAMDGKFWDKTSGAGGAMTGKFWDESSLGSGAQEFKFWDKSSLGGGAMVGKFWDKRTLSGSPTSFVLSSSPIPGRNCLVVQSNFSDLMDALTVAGGATVRFS